MERSSALTAGGVIVRERDRGYAQSAVLGGGLKAGAVPKRLILLNGFCRIGREIEHELRLETNVDLRR